jgi:dihydrofolate reductase
VTSYIFVIAGVTAALEQARAAAGERDVLVNGGADITRQFLRAGLLDRLTLHLVPVALGTGTPLVAEPHLTADWQIVEAAAEEGVVHLTLSTKGRGPGSVTSADRT